MTQVIFYQLENAATPAAIPAELAFACDVVAKCYRTNQKLTVLCADKASAEAFDELLWQLPADSFIAHNLAGEGPVGGAPVEITWGNESALRATVVNVAMQDIPNPNRYKTIFDFVPTDETAKQMARERYKTFKIAGCSMQFQKAAEFN